MCIILIIGFINPNNNFAYLWLKLCSLWSFVSDTEQLELKSALNLDINLLSFTQETQDLYRTRIARIYTNNHYCPRSEIGMEPIPIIALVDLSSD